MLSGFFSEINSRSRIRWMKLIISESWSSFIWFPNDNMYTNMVSNNNTTHRQLAFSLTVWLNKTLWTRHISHEKYIRYAVLIICSNLRLRHYVHRILRLWVTCHTYHSSVYNSLEVPNTSTTQIMELCLRGQYTNGVTPYIGGGYAFIFKSNKHDGSFGSDSGKHDSSKKFGSNFTHFLWSMGLDRYRKFKKKAACVHETTMKNRFGHNLTITPSFSWVEDFQVEWLDDLDLRCQKTWQCRFFSVSYI